MSIVISEKMLIWMSSGPFECYENKTSDYTQIDFAGSNSQVFGFSESQIINVGVWNRI